jgi:hypothetical protein
MWTRLYRHRLYRYLPIAVIVVIALLLIFPLVIILLGPTTTGPGV